MNKKNNTPSQTSEVTSRADASMPENIDISSSLKPPRLPGVNSETITYKQVHAGVSVHIPHSSLIQPEDLIILHWGLHRSSTSVLQTASENNIAGVFCITYNLITHAQYGFVDLHYEIHRAEHLIGSSPTLRVAVSNHAPMTSKQLRRKRNMKRRYPDK